MLYVVVLFLLVQGLLALASPEMVLELTGTHGGSPPARNEIRAVYGGIGLAGAGLLLASGWMAEGETVRWTLGLLCLGMGASRAAGLVMDWPKAALPVVYLVLELAAAVILIGV